MQSITAPWLFFKVIKSWLPAAHPHTQTPTHSHTPVHCFPACYTLVITTTIIIITEHSCDSLQSSYVITTFYHSVRQTPTTDRVKRNKRPRKKNTWTHRRPTNLNNLDVQAGKPWGEKTKREALRSVCFPGPPQTWCYTPTAFLHHSNSSLRKRRDGNGITEITNAKQGRSQVEEQEKREVLQGKKVVIPQEEEEVRRRNVGGWVSG